MEHPPKKIRWPTTVTAIALTPRQKEKPRGKLTAKRIKSRQKEKDSRLKEKPHEKKKKSQSKKKTSRQKEKDSKQKENLTAKFLRY